MRRQARSAAQARTSLILDYGKAGYTLKDRSGQQHKERKESMKGQSRRSTTVSSEDRSSQQLIDQRNEVGKWFPTYPTNH
jgi:hypothetical protein